MEKDQLAAQLRKARAGDVEAFAEVFESLRPVVFAVAQRLAGPNDADDIVMETYLKAWKALPRFSGKSSLKTWLYRITHNCAMDFLRARSRRQDRIMPETEGDGRTIADLADADGSSPADTLERNEMAGVVREALAQLDEKHRNCLLLRYSDGLSYAEIAAATGVSIGTVMSRLYNGKRKLLREVRSIEDD